METYFSDENVILQLCKERIKKARSTNDRQDVTRLTGLQTGSESRPFINTILPSRKHWAKYRPQKRDVPNVDFIALKNATFKLLQATPEPLWKRELMQFIENIRERVFSNEPFIFGSPHIRWEPKEDNKYRPIASLGLADNVINSLTARYIRDFCDSGFEPSSFAFRSPNSEGLMPTHHAAFEEIYRLRRDSTQDLWVAECDIRAFYDSLDHEVALQSFETVIGHLRLLRPGLVIHPRSLEVFRAYLACYNFPQTVLAQAFPNLKRTKRKAEVSWPEEELAEYHNPLQGRAIGIPQGGALSCVISNLVLDKADKAVRLAGEQPGTRLHYFRYCDDMILFACKESPCRKALEAYLEALRALKLPCYEPKPVGVYGEAFWKAKSKAPYCWTGRKGRNHAPWIQFVGYQVRYDGLVRIKSKSVKKQLRKIRDTVDHFKFGIQNQIRKTRSERISASWNQVVRSVQWKLVYSSVGRVKPSESQHGPRSMCWAGGYKALDGKPLATSFLARLDRFREKQNARMHYADIPYGPGISPRNPGKGRRSLPIGSAFSYQGQFRDEGGADLINNPFRTRFERLIRRPARFIADTRKKLGRRLRHSFQRLFFKSGSNYTTTAKRLL